MARSSTTFRPGICYNKGGRRAGIGEVRELARAYTQDAIRTLASIMNDDNAKESCRIAAASELITRGWGKPEQSIYYNYSDERNFEEYTTPQLLAMLKDIQDEKLIEQQVQIND